VEQRLLLIDGRPLSLFGSWCQGRTR
jgi:hypothetical protein